MMTCAIIYHGDPDAEFSVQVERVRKVLRMHALFEINCTHLMTKFDVFKPTAQSTPKIN